MLSVGFLTPSLLRGGAEIWIDTLARNLRRVRPSGVLLTEPKNVDPWLVRRIKQVMPVLAPDKDESLADLVERLSVSSNALISWGLQGLPSLTAGLSTPVVDVSHSSGKWPQQRQLVAGSCRGAAYHVGVSRTASQAFPGDLPGKPETIYNGIDFGGLQMRPHDLRRQLGIKPHENVALFLGRLEPVKAPHRLIQALADQPNWKIVVVGAGSLRSWMEEISNGKVVFAGQQNTLAPWYDIADVTCVFSHHEGFPLSVLESWFCGTPVAISPLPFAQEMVNDFGSVLAIARSNQPADLYDAISRATGNRKMAEEARQVVTRHFNAQAFAHRWEDFLLHVCTDWHSRLRI